MIRLDGLLVDVQVEQSAPRHGSSGEAERLGLKVRQERQPGHDLRKGYVSIVEGNESAQRRHVALEGKARRDGRLFPPVTGYECERKGLKHAEGP